MTRILIILFLIAAFSCQNKTTVDKKIEIDNWRLLKIGIDDNSFYIQTNEDTSYYYERFRDTNYAIAHNGGLRSELTKFVMGKAERDTLVSLALQAITNPVQTDQFITCYAGQNVDISLEEMSTTISCNYSSISDWTKISPTLFKMNKIISDKIKQK